ncbi:MAG: RluA family pseudouridine synthase [Spirochaetae bacterium HGW-Spirochaetae-7]|jgi:23S rRNA pseudouridine955/2504/2580 synthase/23S rRNA pseudouridine1911/1915/1917 synthase|nr:MAG: RluA family pseudouridine synthase [Spirochaetae bacterium HGW-Spirochaetae-7]
MSIEITVLFKDDWLLAVNKPSGIQSAPDRYAPDATAVSRELEMEHGRLWPLHAPDADTSGVLLFTRDEGTHRALSKALEAQGIKSVSHAVVSGRPVWTEIVCDLSLTPDGDRMHRTIIDGAGKPSVTEFLVLGTYSRMAIIEARSLTDRTHQVRVHLTALGYPVACDPLYGDGKPLFLSTIKRRWKGDEKLERPLISRTALHAFSIEFTHPATGGAMTIEAPYPKDFRAIVTQLRKM